MVKDYKKLKKFENELILNSKVDIEKNYKILDAMYREAVELGVFPLKNLLEGIEIDIKIAKAINSVQKINKKNRKRAK
jgi:ribosomal 50S subunit-associated protein YjgA (DUF615 family)